MPVLHLIRSEYKADKGTRKGLAQSNSLAERSFTGRCVIVYI